MRFAISRLALLLGLLLCLPSVTTAGQKEQVIVSSKMDTEGALLGNIIAQALENSGIPVQVRIQLGPTKRLREALLSGEIDIYPEYTGNGAVFHAMEVDPAYG